MSITTDNRSEQAIATVEHIDPQTLEFEDNVRDEVQLDKEFLASLREHGVIVPIIAVRDAEGRTLVREGQCRTLGAREVGLTRVPVYVMPADDADADTATVQRIVQQMVANDRRKDLTNGQRARAIQQMLDTGMSATKVAKKLAMSPRRDQRRRSRRQVGHRAQRAERRPARLPPGRSTHRVHCYVDTRSDCMSDHRGGVRP